jgi:hypothetical protein
MTAVPTDPEYAAIVPPRPERSSSAVALEGRGEGVCVNSDETLSSVLSGRASKVQLGEKGEDPFESPKRGNFFGEFDLWLPRCVLPPAEELEPVEAFVEAAVRKQEGLPETGAPDKNYSALCDIMRSKRDLSKLRKVLIALRTSGRGSTLHLITSSRRHARLLHYVLRLNPFELPSTANRAATASGETVPGVSLVANYDLADSQLHFLSAVVSANAIFVIPTLTFAWSLLTSRQDDSVPAER